MDDSASQTGHFKGDGKKRREKGREGRKNSERRALVSGKKRAETLGRSWVFRWPEFAVAAAAMGVPAQFPLAGLVGPVRSREVLPIVRGNEKKHSQEKKKKFAKKKPGPGANAGPGNEEPISPDRASNQLRPLTLLGNTL